MKNIAIIRESIGRIVTMLTEKKIKVTQQGASAFVQYHPKTGAIQRVNIPYLNDDASEDFISAVQGFLDHEVGHVLFSDQTALLSIGGESAALKNLDNLIEDVFIERKMSERFSGSAFNLQNVRSYFLEKCTRPAIESALKEGNLELAKAYAIVAGFRGWAGQAIAKEFIQEPMIEALLAPLRKSIPDELIERLQTVNSSWEVLALTRELMKYMSKPEETRKEDKGEKKKSSKAEKSEETDDEAGETEGGSDEAGESIEPGGEESKSTEADDSGKKRDEDEKMDADASSEDGKSAPSSESTDSAGDFDGEDEEPAESGAKPEVGEDGDEGDGEDEITFEELLEAIKDFDSELAEALSKEAKGALDEGSGEYRIFTTEYDKVIPAPNAKNPAKAIADVEKLTKDKIGVMSKSLERGIAAQAKKAWISGQRKGRVSSGALFKTAVGDDRVFRQRYETKAKNTAISLVIDCSGSMRGGRIQLASQTAYAISSVLSRLRISFEVIGFTTTDYDSRIEAEVREEGTDGKWSRNVPLYLPVFKSFGEKFDASTKSRIAGLYEKPGWLAENIDGECIQIAARRLALQKVERRIMIVLSDGSPSCPGTKNLHSHLTTTIKSLEKDQIEVIGIGIQTESVRSFYPKNIVIYNAEALPVTTMGELTKLLLA